MDQRIQKIAEELRDLDYENGHCDSETTWVSYVHLAEYVVKKIDEATEEVEARHWYPDA